MDYKYLKPFVLPFFLFCSFLAEAQFASGISTSADGYSLNQTICASQLVTITLDSTGNNGGYVFYRERQGTRTTVQFNNVTPTFTTTTIQDGDVYYGERFDYNLNNPVAMLTDRITFTVLTLIGAPFMGGTIDQTDQFVCAGFVNTNLTVSGGSTGSAFDLQWQRSTDNGNTFTNIVGATGDNYTVSALTSTTHFRRRVMRRAGGTCEKFSTVFIAEVSDLDPGSLDTSIITNICYDTSPGTLGIGTSVNPTASRGTTAFQWQENVNGGGWNDIVGATNLTYTPPNLTQDTEFRRDAINIDTASGLQCNYFSNEISIDVEVQIIPGTTTGTQTICNGETPASIALMGATSGPGIVYEWQISTDGVNYNDIGVSGNLLTFTTTSSYTPIFTSYYRARVGTVTPSCDAFSSVSTVTVLPENVSLTSNAINGIYCSGDSIDLIATGTNSTYQFFLDGIQQSSSNSPTISFSNLTGTHVISLVAVTMNNCMRRIDMTVMENNVEPGSISGDQLLCAGAMAQEVTSITSGTANGISINSVSTARYQWQSSLDALSWFNIPGENQENYSPPSSLSSSVYLRRLAENTISGVTCNEPSNEIFISITPTLAGGTMDIDSQPQCGTGTSIPLIINGGTIATNVSYQWEEAAFPGGTFSPIPGATQVSYTPSTTISMQYRRMVFSATSGSCFAYSTIHTVYAIDISPGSLDTSQNTTILIGSTPSTIENGVSGQNAMSSNSTTITYNWEQSINSGSLWTPIVGATSSSYSPPAILQTTMFRRRAFATIDGNMCDDVTNSITIAVSNILIPGTVVADQMVCSTLFPNDLVLNGASSGALINYIWETSVDNMNYSPISNTLQTLSFTSTTTWNPVMDITYYRVRVIDTATGNSAISGVASITLLPADVSLTSDAVGDVFCVNDDVTFTATGIGSLTYEFLINGISHQVSTTNVYVHQNFTNSATVTLIAQLPNGCSRLVERRLTQNFVTTGTVSGTQTICNGEVPSPITSLIGATAMSMPVTATTTANYQWESSFDGSVWNNVLNATSEDYTPGVLNQTIYFRRTIINTINGKMCSESSNVIPITVLASIDRGTINQNNQVICEGDIPLELTVSNGTVGSGVVYQWEQAMGATSTVFTSIPLETSANFTPPSLSQTMQYRRRTISSLGGCTEISNTHTVFINTLNPGSLDTNQSTTICYGSSIPVLNSGALGQDASSTTGSITYQWRASLDGVVWTDIASATSVSYQPTSTMVDTFYQRVAVSTVSGTFCTEESNSILIQVESQINVGVVNFSQRICAGDSFANLSITNIPAPVGTTYQYQWQESTDNQNFSNITGENNLVLTGRALSSDMYYRCLVTASGIMNCEDASDSVFIEVDPAQTLVNAAGSNTNQTVCPTEAIQPIVLQYGGSATGITLPNLSSVGLSITQNIINRTYTISGVLSSTVTFDAITITSTDVTCPLETINFQLNLVDSPAPPNNVFIDNALILENGAQVSFPNLCFGTNTSQFSVNYTSPIDAGASLPNWELINPIAAGAIDPSTGIMTWNSGFSGNARFRVRGQSVCSVNVFSTWSNDFEVNVGVLEIPPISPTTLAPIQLSTVSFTGGTSSGGDPVCVISTNTPDTYYVVPTLTNTSTNQITNIVWTLEVLQAGNSSVPIAGTIDSNSGIVAWNPGFWGVVNINADPINCAGENDPRLGPVDPLLRQTRSVLIPEGITPFVDIHLTTGSTLPSCPSETASFTTAFFSNLSSTESITWSINNSNAGVIDPVTGVLSWAANFSGGVDVTARASLNEDTIGICEIAEGSILINIQGDPVLSLSSGFNSNVIDVCNNDAITPIRYDLQGAIDGVSVTGLPIGLFGDLTETPQETSIVFTGNSAGPGEVYTISLPFQNYAYTTLTSGESASFVVQQLVSLINNSDPTVTASNIGSTITFNGVDLGEEFRVSTMAAGVNPQITTSPIATIAPQRFYEISGSPNDSEGVYSFVITSNTSSTNCTLISSTGVITISPVSTITLISSNEGQIVCNNTPMVDMVYEIENAQNATVDPPSSSLLMTDGLPNGITASYLGGQLRISGTPVVSLTDSTTFNFTIRTQNNRFGCQETSLAGSLVVLPDIQISLTSNAATQNQQVCAGTPIQTTSYLLSSPTNPNTNNFSFDFSGLPNGVGGSYDSGNRRLLVFGTPNPSPALTVPTLYTYSLTVSGCSGSQTVTGTLTVYPEPRLELISALGTENQSICDDDGIEEIRYQLEGATGFTFSTIPNAPWINFFHDPASQQLFIRAAPNFTVDQETVYSYSVAPTVSPFGCSAGPDTTGTITLLPRQEFQLTSGVTTLNQEVCNGSPIEDIVLEFNENVIGTTTGGFPPGLSFNTNLYNKIYTVNLVGANIPANVSYEIKINANTYAYTTQTTLTPSQLASELANLVHRDSDVTATDDGLGMITITGVTRGIPFSVTTYEPTSFYAIFVNKQTVQSHGELVISGTPISSNTSSTIYSYTVSSTGVNCSPTSVSGTLQVDPVPVVSLTSSVGTDNQVICGNTALIPIEYSVTGTVFSASFNGLPPGIQGVYDQINQEFNISGMPLTNNTLLTTYPYEITVIGNPGICDPMIIAGSITVNPFERFELVSAPGTLFQTTCVGDPIIPIEFEISGNVSRVDMISGNLPSGVTGSQIPQNFIVDISIMGSPTAQASETFSIQINSDAPIVYESPSAGISPIQIAQELVNRINPNSIVTASENNNGVVRLEGNVPGDYFAVIHSNGPSNQALLQFPVEAQSNLQYVISGTPSVTLSSPISYSFGLETVGGLCTSASVQGSITLNIGSEIELSTPILSASQVVCELEPISRIEYQVTPGTVTGASISWLPFNPAGLSSGFDPVTGIYHIEGTPDRQANTTVFSYTINTTGNINGCAEDGISGNLTVNKIDEINLISNSGTDNQQVCGDLNSGLSITDIIYELTGTATNLIVTGLAPGLSSNFDLVSKRLTISGTPDAVTIPTSYNYFVSASSAICSADVVSGTITLNILSDLTLTSSPDSINQVNNLAICAGSEIVPIVYAFGTGVASVTVSNLPPGVGYVFEPNRLTISGRIDSGFSPSQVFDYSVQVMGSNGCPPPANQLGSIGIITLPEINKNFINANDVQHVSCDGAQDGSINIPELSPAFDLRITGNQNGTSQVDHVTLTNTPVLSDIYSIEINGITYSHTVIPSVFGGPTQNSNEVAIALIDVINAAVGSRESAVAASLTNASIIVLTAKTPGLPFVVNQTFINSSGSPMISSTTILQNKSIRYDFSWEGPNGFRSTSLNISNLEVGEYELTVTTNNCISNSATFTIEEPEPIIIETESCNGAFSVDVTGGAIPYTFRLYDRNNVLIETRTSNGGHIYQGLTPGTDYLFEVTDIQCSIAKAVAIELPFGIIYNTNAPVVVADYCNDSSGTGSIELGGNAGGESFTGGSSQFTYRWSGPNFSSTSRDIYNLTPGIYTVTVTDAVLGCSDQVSYEIESVDPLVISIDPQIVLDSTGAIPLTCEGENSATIQINVSGGTGNYSYSWTKNGTLITGALGTRLDNLGAGIYSVTVTDSPPSGVSVKDLCQVTQQFNITEPTALSLKIDTNSLSTRACQDDVFSIPVIISGGTPPYQLNLNSGFRTTTTSDLTYAFENIDASSINGMLNISVIDANSCSYTASNVLISVPDAYEFSTETTDIDCRNNALGQIKVTSTPTIPASTTLIIQWQSADLNRFDTWSSSDGLLTDLIVPGNYRVTISTPEGCQLYNEEFLIEDVYSEALEVEIVKEQGIVDCIDDRGRIELDIKNGIPPYTIVWEMLGTGGTNWVELPAIQNNAIVIDLDAGTYRASVRNAAQSNSVDLCLTDIRTRNIILEEEQFALTNISTSTSISCDLNNTAGGTFSFRLINTLNNPDNLMVSNNFTIDGTTLNLGNSNFEYNQQKDLYTISEIEPGIHMVVVQSTTGTLSNCLIEQEFTIPEKAEPIIYSGTENFTLDVCTSSIQLIINPTEVTGGKPYSINGIDTYEYSWEFTPAVLPDETVGITRNFVGDQILEAEPGTYLLTITDSVNCSNDPQNPIVITIESLVDRPFSVQGALTDPDGNLVFATTDNCSENGDNGAIGIEVMGGLRPYEIRWFYQEPGIQLFEEQVELRNRTIINNSATGVYRYEISSLQDSCPDTATAEERLFTYLEGTVTLTPNPDLFILSGPFIENQDLCSGLPGKITVEVFDNNQGELFFYYEDVLLVKDEDQRTPNTYTVFVENPVDSGFLKIVNEEGCSIEKKIELALGEASFTFSSVSKEASGVILARENVVFENTSALPYSHFEFYYGDNSEPYFSRDETTSATVTVNRIPTHQYPTSGTYNAILKIYNNSGCFSEEVLSVPVGNGYSIQLPNVFTPNNDGVNDIFRPLTSGLTKIEFSIYSFNGSLIYTETVVGDSDSFIKIEDTLNDGGLKGWDGADASPSPYYVYSVRGTLADEVTQVERSGTFTLIR